MTRIGLFLLLVLPGCADHAGAPQNDGMIAGDAGDSPAPDLGLASVNDLAQAGDAALAPQSSRNGLSNDPNYFPLGVWLQTPAANAQAYKAIGINLFVGLYDGNTEASLQAEKAAGMLDVSSQDANGLASANNDVIKAWLNPNDEPDNAQSDGNGGYLPCIDPSVIQSQYSAMKAKDPTRPVYLGLGRGVADVNWGGRGTCTGKTSMYPEYAKGADILDYDVYPVNEGLPLEIVATGIDNLRTWSGGNKPVFGDIETTNYDATQGPSPAEVKTEVWMEIVHGAVGIVYFCHIFKPTFIEAGLLSDTAMAAAVKAINAQITKLAPALNAPAAGVQVASASPVDATARSYGGSVYVFAVSMRGQATTATFTVTGKSGGQVTVLDENRSLPLANGQFADPFAGYAVHLYKVD